MRTVKTICQFAFLMLITISVSGCFLPPLPKATNRYIDAYADENPIKPNIKLATNSNVLPTPFPKETIVGEWEGEYKVGGYGWSWEWEYENREPKGHGWQYQFNDEIVHVRLMLKSDGTFVCKVQKSGDSYVSECEGKWSYRILQENETAGEHHHGQGELYFETGTSSAIALNTRPIRKVFWFSEDEFCMRHLASMAEVEHHGALGHILEKETFLVPEIWSFNIDECLNESYTYSVYAQAFDGKKFLEQADWHQKSKIVNILTPMRFVRVGGAGTVAANYKIKTMNRKADRDFAYDFELEVQNGDITPRTWRSIQRGFRSAVKAEYMDAFSLTDAKMLQVDFSEFSIKGNSVSGTAEVIVFVPRGLVYDSQTRTGRLSVKVMKNQFEAARRYARMNIAEIARDKNIVIEGSRIPPDAQFTLGREELKDGNILEIEFKTE